MQKYKALQKKFDRLMELWVAAYPEIQKSKKFLEDSLDVVGDSLRGNWVACYTTPIMQPQPGVFLSEIVDLIKKDPRFLVYDYKPGDKLCYVMNRKEKVEYILAMETSCFKFSNKDMQGIEKEKRIPRY